MSNVMPTRRTAAGLWRETPLGTTQLRSALRRGQVVAVEHSQLECLPLPELAGEYPPEYSLVFDIYRYPDGNRRLAFRGGYGPFVQFGSSAGLAMQLHHHPTTGEQRFSLQITKQLFNRVRVGHEHLGRRFAASRDLYIRPSGRVGPAISLLPAAVGLTPDGGGHPWSIHTLTRRGRVEARADGISSRSNDVAIRYGLTLAADMNPLVVRNVEETKNLVFIALFDHRELPRRLSQEQLADVQERLLVAIEEHADDTWADFQNWFSGGHNNLVQTLARKAGYSPLPRDVVKAGLLTIGWQSYDYVSSYLATFAVAVRNALSEPLTAAERRQYDAMYLPQPYFGGLQLVLLMERTGLIGLVVRRLWESPEDESLIGSLHRLLAIYAELAPARRAADRRFKALRRELSRRQSPEEGRASNDERAALRRLDWSRLEVTVRTLLRQRRAGCTECTDACTWNMDVESMDDDSLQLCVTCEDHDFKSECRFTFAELLAATTTAQPPETPS